MKQNKENRTIKEGDFDEWLSLEHYELNVFVGEDGGIRYNIYTVTDGMIDVTNQVGEGDIELNLVTGTEKC